MLRQKSKRNTGAVIRAMAAMRLLALLAACCRANALRLTRRALIPAATALVATKPAFADDEAEVKPKRVEYGPGTVEVPGTWKIDGETISESILGTITSSVRARSAATQAQSIDQFGNIDKLDLTKLGLMGNRGKGDVVAAKRRKDGDRLFYEWDLAVPPTNGCARSEQELIVCPPVEVALISATVADGQLVVWECGVDQRQWKSYGKSLRAVRSSFRLGG